MKSAEPEKSKRSGAFLVLKSETFLGDKMFYGH